MKVFISHAFGGGDEVLAGAFKDGLEEADIDGYLAEKTQRHDLMLSDKIRQEIDESDWLVAIITKQSYASASVHEEIGYALGKGVRVALMVEEGVKKNGVLVHGREYEVFTVPEFATHSRKMIKSISNSPRAAPFHYTIREATKGFLEGRNILSVKTSNFAVNEQFPHLHSPLSDDEKPVVLFTACPHDLRNNVDVTAPEFVEWVGATTGVTVDGRQTRVQGLDPNVDIGRLLAIDEHPSAHPRIRVRAYREFLSTGFFEFGTSYLFFDRNKRGQIEMHLCYIVGEFWSFLVQARLFYRKTGLDLPFSVFASIKNSDRLRLGNYGNEVMRPSQYGRSSSNPRAPSTHHKNILLHYPFKSAREASDGEIARAARDAAKRVCNAYGETTPRCYNEDGSFSWALWDFVARNSPRGWR